MNKTKYLVYLDILGFKELAEEIGNKTGFKEDIVRQKFLSEPLEKQIEEIDRKEIQVSKGISEIEGSDNYVLIVDDIQTVFEIVERLITMEIQHRDYNFIPLEIAVDRLEIDEKIEIDLKNRSEVITSLKRDIVTPYRGYYQNKHGMRIKDTFILFTEEFFGDLEPLDKRCCKRISYNGKTFFAADVNKILKRARTLGFLEKIGRLNSKLYGRVDELFVPSIEYEDMVNTLDKKRFLFITGTPEYGKTYTAVRLLWEYYNEGYQPRWIRGEEKEERIDVRRKLEDIKAELKPGYIVYFEDPFGKTKYEKRESLEREIGTIIDSVRRFEDAYAIITSREEVFKEFEKEKISTKDLKEFKEKLNIMRPSYDYERRKEILLKWAEEEGCKWLKDGGLKELVLERMRDEKVLPTPLSIKDFVFATTKMEKEDEVEEMIKEKSRETARAFADEIRNMSDDKVLFLLFPFIFWFDVEFVRETYREMVEELNLEDAWEFDRVLGWFMDDKIGIFDEGLAFSHDSYSEAFEYVLFENGFPTRINREIFRKLLLKLAEKDEAAEYVAMFVEMNFDKLYEDLRNILLLKLADKDEAAYDVVITITDHFDELPEDVKNLLFKLAKTRGGARALGWSVTDDFDKFPEKIRDLLFELAEKDEVSIPLSLAVEENFGELPEDVRNKLLLKLAERSGTERIIARVVAQNLDNLSDEVKNLLDELQEPLQYVIGDLSMDKEWKQEEALRLISNALPKLDMSFVSSILSELSKSEYEDVREETRRLQAVIFDDSKG